MYLVTRDGDPAVVRSLSPTSATSVLWNQSGTGSFTPGGFQYTGKQAMVLPSGEAGIAPVVREHSGSRYLTVRDSPVSVRIAEILGRHSGGAAGPPSTRLFISTPLKTTGSSGALPLPLPPAEVSRPVRWIWDSHMTDCSWPVSAGSTVLPVTGSIAPPASENRCVSA